jgi:putative salt-induced outer membrane protein YdiY
VWIVIVVIAITWATPSSAQDAPPPPPPPAFEGTAEFSFVGTSGNSSTQTLGAGSSLTFRRAGWKVTSKASFVRSKDRDLIKAQSFGLATEAGKALSERLSIVSRHEYQRDRFAGIQHRNTLDLGVSMDTVDTAAHTLTLKAGVGYASEQRLTGEDLSTAIGTTGLDYEWVLSSSATFENSLHTEFSLQNSADRRLNNVASLSAKLNSTFSLKVKHTTRWVKSPVPGFRKTDTITAIALVAKF